MTQYEFLHLKVKKRKKKKNVLYRKMSTIYEKEIIVPGMVTHIYNPSTWEAKAGGLQVWGQPGLYNETLSQKKK
jgi:hypothetical protein